ncbi:hypothetical protein BaRGS_00010296 [Batillaria attramentaria]|uniref:Uncharacterized protein n=1 Tax=Batillaria attramentaria TaxID=370345 RepID=A0ABD0LH09_9CAEN
MDTRCKLCLQEGCTPYFFTLPTFYLLHDTIFTMSPVTNNALNEAGHPLNSQTLMPVTTITTEMLWHFAFSSHGILSALFITRLFYNRKIKVLNTDSHF